MSRNSWLLLCSAGITILFLSLISGIRLFSETSSLTDNYSIGSIFSKNTTISSDILSIQNLWVDAVNGNDNNNGLSASTAFRTIQHAANLAQPGTTIHILPGTYRESITPANSGTASSPILYLAENGPGTVKIRGSDPSSSLTWTQLTTNTIGLPPGVEPKNIYYADLSNWGLGNSPRFVMELDGNGEVISRLPLAREPDWIVDSEWKYHEYWWAADGGSSQAGCDPRTDPDPENCDSASRSLTQLTDTHSDTQPIGIEAGNLTTLGNLTGGTLNVLDTQTGTYIFIRKIIAHDVQAGRITVDQNCEVGYGSNTPGLGWGSKYFVEGLPYLLDSPGEWWYDQASGRLYLWPTVPGNPAGMNVEISRREDGLSLRNQSYITIDGLIFEFFNNTAIVDNNGALQTSFHDKVLNSIL